MERENQRIAITKRLLKESILSLLKEKELDKISVTELCREAGINRATFYRHYQIPRDVLMEIQKDLYYELKRKIPIPKKAEELKTTIDAICHFMEQNSDLLRTIIRCNSDTDFVNFVNEVYMELWQELRLPEVLKGLAQDEIQLLTLYSAGGSYFMLRSWLLGNTHKSASEMADYLLQLLNKTGNLIFSDPLGFSDLS